MIKIGTELKRLMPAGVSQKIWAIEWLEHWRAANASEDPLTVDTVETRLSECLNERTKAGVRFFFESDARWATTAAVLGCTESDGERLRGIAGFGAGAATSSSVLVDLVGLGVASSLERTLNGAIAALGDAAGVSITCLLTPEQVAAIPPRALDGLRVERLESAAAALTRLAMAARQGAMVVSERPVMPLERWAALSTLDRVEVAPTNALALFLECGALPGATPAGRPLSRLAPEATPQARAIRGLPARAAARRRLVLALVGGDSLDAREWLDVGPREVEQVSVAQRVQWATDLGVEASATESEWVEACRGWIAPLPLVSDEVKDLLAPYDDYVQQTYARKTSEGIELVNPAAGDDERLRALGVKLHHPGKRAATELRAFVEAAARRTAGEHFADPHLDSLLEEHAQDEASRRILRLAREAMLFSQGIPPARRIPAADAAAKLRHLLATHDSWPVALHVGASTSRKRAEGDAGRLAVQPFLDTGVGRDGDVAPSSCRTVRLVRGQRLRFVRAVDQYSNKMNVSRIVVPGRHLGACYLSGPPSQWTDQLLEGARLRERIHEHSELAPGGWGSTRTVRTATWEAPLEAASIPSLEISDVLVDEFLWNEAEESAAFALHALRVGCRVEEWARLPGGGLVVPVAAGLFARIAVSEEPTAAGRPPEAGLARNCADGLGITDWRRTFRLATASSYGWPDTEIEAALPEPLEVVGEGLHLTIEFRPSLLAGAASEHAAVTKGVAGQIVRQRIEDKRRRNDD